MRRTREYGKLYRVLHVEPFQEIFRDKETGFGAVVFGLRLLLEEGKSLTLVNIPPEIAATIDRLNRGEAPPERQSLYDVLANNERFRIVFGEVLDKVVIDELNMDTGLYNARAILRSEGLTLRVTMIPSHAIYLALVLDRPIYVTEELVRLEEEFDSFSPDEYEEDDEDEE